MTLPKSGFSGRQTIKDGEQGNKAGGVGAWALLEDTVSELPFVWRIQISQQTQEGL
jgi:hypothetical protein